MNKTHIYAASDGCVEAVAQADTEERAQIACEQLLQREKEKRIENSPFETIHSFVVGDDVF